MYCVVLIPVSQRIPWHWEFYTGRNELETIFHLHNETLIFLLIQLYVVIRHLYFITITSFLCFIIIKKVDIEILLIFLNHFIILFYYMYTFFFYIVLHLVRKDAIMKVAVLVNSIKLKKKLLILCNYFRNCNF